MSCCYFSISQAYAECNPDYCAQVYVDQVYTNTNGTVYVGTSGTESNLLCGAVSGVYLTLDLRETGGIPYGSGPAASAIYSQLLTAQTTNKKVNIQVNNDSTGCPITYVVSYRN